MLTEFSAIHFRGFQEIKLDSLARINLIIGKNNVGIAAHLKLEWEVR